MSLGVDVDKKDPQGRTPMMVATTMEPEEFGMKLIKMCLRHNANVNERDRLGRSILGYACIHGKEKVANCVLRSCGHTLVKHMKDHNGDVALNLAAAYGQDGIIRQLIPRLQRDGLPVDVRNNQGFTALLLAAKYGHYKCAQTLIQEGNASPNLRDNEFFMSAMEWAKYSQSHFERELKLLRVIKIRNSTRSQLMDLKKPTAPPWCSNQQELNALPTLTCMTSGERPNFQRKKQLVTQLRTRQSQLDSLEEAFMRTTSANKLPLPGKTAVTTRPNTTGTNASAGGQMVDIISLGSDLETSPPARGAGHGRSKTFPRFVIPGRKDTPGSPSYLCNMFKMYEGSMGVRPSQASVLQQLAAAVSGEDSPSPMDEDPEDGAEMETPAPNMSRRKSIRGGNLKQRHSSTSSNSHSQSLAVPQVLRKTKSNLVA